MQTTKSNWWQGLTVQPIVILAILIALIIWLSTAQFTNTELATLTLSNLLNLTVQHLELTAVSIVVVLIAFWLGFGFTTAAVALILYAFLPVLKNTMVGLDAVDPKLVEAGRGMGMSAVQVLFQIELPLAVPIMLAGIRTALVLLVGTATLATFVDGGGLGILITTGVNLALNRVLITGSLLVALLALAVDWIARVLEHTLRPKGL